MSDKLLYAVLAERFPDHLEVKAEAKRPVPPVLVEDRRLYRKGGSGLTRLEWLLMQEMGRRCAD